MSCNLSELNSIVGLPNRTRFFDEGQEGGRATAIVNRSGNRVVWENGTWREKVYGLEGGVMCDATWIDKSDIDQVRQVLCWRRVYAERKLELAVVVFEREKEVLLEIASNAEFEGIKPPDEHRIKELKRMKRNVRVWEKKLTVILELLEPQPQVIEKSVEEQKAMNANQREGARILEVLKMLEV